MYSQKIAPRGPRTNGLCNVFRPQALWATLQFMSGTNPPSAPGGADPVPYWLLIAVLASNLPLRPEVTMRLFQAAYRLHKRQENVERINGDFLTGKVVRLQRDMALGSVAGPAFEADISTPQGEGRVNFLLTRQGLELADEAVENGNTRLLGDDPGPSQELADLAWAAQRGSGGYVN